MNQVTEYPLSIRDVAPCEGAERLTGTRPDGLPDGVHTGGAWLVGGLVYKPLDGRPYMNAECHIATQEAECLEAMAGRDLFPRNWWIEERNGRRFLVRRKAYILEPGDMDKDMLLRVERAVRGMNAAGWEMGDAISIGLDPKTYEYFIVDLSSAHRMTGKGAWAANDWTHIRRLFEAAGADWLLLFRQNARNVTHSAEWTLEHYGYEHVYASFPRPISLMWASLGDVLLVHTERANWGKAIPHTWVVSREPLDEDMLRRYELTWGWSPFDGMQVAGAGE
jgi:hypothetical protein